jgi:hypothetical protein
VLDSTSLAAEGCAAPNNAIDPGETVIVLFAFKNTGGVSTTNLVVTLLATNGVVSPSAPQTYGALSGGGPPVSQPFTFSATGACGGTVTANLRLQDGPTNYGTATVTFPLGSTTTVLTQNFDSVTAPALPAGWTTSATGAATNWATETATRDTVPNAAFSGDAGNIGINELDSPSMALPAGSFQLFFKNYYDLEFSTVSTNIGFDGGVLEIKIGTNSFVDILTAGGSFVSNGYNRTITNFYGNPLSNRPAWSGNTGGFTNTIVNLPASAGGQNIQLRWRCGSDNGAGRTGWRIDSVSINGRSCCGNTAPTLPLQTNRTIAELTALTVTNTASDSSAGPGTLGYSLVNPLAGAQIDTNGIITWTPTESQGPSSNTFTTIVSDNAFPPLKATNSFTVTVLDVNSPPVLPNQGNRTIAALAALTVTNAATDTDIPANTLTYSLLNPPTGAAIDAAGVIIWTPNPSQGFTTNIFTTIVSDNGVPQLSATNSFTVTVLSGNSPPVLPNQPDRTIAKLTTITVTNTATDADLPPNNLTYVLLSSPTGAAIDSTGVITWTPNETQSPSTNAFTTRVTDDGTPPLSATNSFLVLVDPAPLPLAIQSIIVSNGIATIMWNAVSGQVYRLQYEDDLTGSNWHDAPPDTTALGTTGTASQALSNSAQRFYRVFLVP